jgi:hypothetical protein
MRLAEDVAQAKDTAVSVQSWRDPEDSNRLKLPDFMTVGT